MPRKYDWLHQYDDPRKPYYLVQYYCLVEAAIIPDNDASRAAWKAMSPYDRRAVWESELAAPARKLDPRAKDISVLLTLLRVSGK